MPNLNDLATYVAGSPLINTRQFAFGGFLFPLTTQKSSDVLKLAFDQKRIPFMYGDHIVTNTNLKGREIVLTTHLGSGIIGTGGNTLSTYTDLEAERTFLAGLMNQGRSQLYTRFDRYSNAFLVEFTEKPMQDGGMYRYSDWELKFIADDPRFYSASAHTGTSASQAVTHLGNTNAYPIFTISGACVAPLVKATVPGGGVVSVKFSTLTMSAGDTLVVICDPRPENRSRAAIYTPNGGTSVNALKYTAAADFTNTADYSQFLPYVPSGASATTLAVTVNSGSPTVSISYNDTWI